MPTTTSPTAPGTDSPAQPHDPTGLRHGSRRAAPAGARPTDGAATAPLLDLPASLPSLAEQAERLIELGVADLAGLTHAEVRAAARPSQPGTPEADGTPGASGTGAALVGASGAAAAGLLVVAPALAPVSALAPLLRRGDRAGFVVTDMTDVDDFAPIAGLAVPASPLYVVAPPDRGDDLANWSPDEALPELEHRGRSPLTLAEGVHWLLQAPETLDRNHCFMTIGSRLRKANGRLDARTPALWISNGTGRDGRERRDAPKVGWCWAGNRHTWLGFASTTSRRAA